MTNQPHKSRIIRVGDPRNHLYSDPLPARTEHASVPALKPRVNQPPPNVVGKLSFLVIHCSLTPIGMTVTGDMIKEWHMGPPPNRGWSRVGYSELVHQDGKIELLVPYDDDHYVETDEYTFGVLGKNYISRHVCVIGGQDNDKNQADTLTIPQYEALRRYCHEFVRKQPQARIAGHYQVYDNRTCPNFDVPFYLELMQIPKNSIFYG